MPKPREEEQRKGKRREVGRSNEKRRGADKRKARRRRKGEQEQRNVRSGATQREESKLESLRFFHIAWGSRKDPHRTYSTWKKVSAKPTAIN